MQSTFTQEADFRQERDFGRKIGATFEFLGAHWRPLGKCLLYFVLPGALLMGIGLGLVTNITFNYTAAVQNNSSTASAAGLASPTYFSGFGLAMLGALVGGLLLFGTLYAYVQLVLDTAQAPTPAQVWQQIKQRLGKMLAAFGLLIGLYITFIALVGGLMTLSLNFGFLLLLLFPLFFYVLVPLALYFPVLWLEDSSLTDALRRCFYLIQGKWWSTFGLLMVSGLLQSMVALLFILPQYAVIAGKMLKIPGLSSDVLGVVTQCIYALGILFTSTIPLLALLFQYFNLVERKEGVGLRLLIDSIGRGAAPVASDPAYRPDEQGEY